MYKPPNYKPFQIGDDSAKDGGLERVAYERSYLFAECRPVKELLAFWKTHKKFHKLKFEDWILERDKCRKDVFYLGTVLGHDFVDHVHREMCSFYVQKHFDGVYHDGYTLADVRKALQRHHNLRETEMQMLAPRGSFKSTTNKVDCASWLLNAPDVRIMILSGENKLAEKFMKDIKGYFHQPEDADPTRIQTLFPEYVMDPDDAVTTVALSCPARILPQGGDPSLWVNSIASNLSGWHCDILKGDDVVTDENSNTEGTREKVNEKWTGALNLVDEWGFIDNIGTRYFPDDLFGERIKLGDELPFKFLKQAAWKVKPEFKQVKLEDLKEHMVILYFPEKLSYESLRGKLLRNKIQFLCQQMNEPAGGDDLIHFDEDLLRAAHQQLAATPLIDKKGYAQPIFMAFDTSSGSKSGDFSAGAACVFEQRADGASVMHVFDVVFGKWKPSELAKQVVDFAFKWKPRIIIIEDWAGSELVQREIATLATARGITIPITWLKRSMEYNAKKNRIGGLEILLANQRIKFVLGWWTDELMKQFTRYTGDRVRRRNDDIPDAIGYLQKFMPDQLTGVAQMEVKKPDFPANMTTNHIFNVPKGLPQVAANKPETNPIDEQFFGGMGIY
jgi:hypothetical protein